MNNKTGKPALPVGRYFKYAIGEVVLVVIGILIALSVNNYNENKKQEAIIIEALKVIHREISEDIEEANAAIEYYRHKDSLINFIMTHELSKKDFQGAKGIDYVTVGSNRRKMTVNTNGFELLMANSDNIPNKYQGLIMPLKMVYKSETRGLEMSSSYLDETMRDYLRYLDKKEWNYQLNYFNKLDDSALDFYVNDPAYKNHLAKYQSAAIDNYYADLNYFRKSIEDLYNQLTDLLDLHDLIESDSNYYNHNSRDYLHFLGTFVNSTDTAIISMDSDKLVYQYNSNIKEDLIPISEHSFIIRSDDTFNDFTLDSTGRITHHNWHFGRLKSVMKKME